MGASLMNSTISLDDIYPVGSIYMNINSTNPANLFGGVWEQIKERFMLGCGDTHAAGSTGGEFTHKLVSSELPSPIETTLNIMADVSRWGGFGCAIQNIPDTSYVAQASRLTITGGGNSPHNITPPYLAVYIWQRTA